MPKSISTSEAKNQLSAMIGWARQHNDAVIVESHGKPRAVIMSFDEYERFQVTMERQRRLDALARLRQVQAEVSARNQHLTEEQIEGLADRFAHDMVDDLAREGKLRFERDMS